MRSNLLLTAALAYAKLGWPVVPLHTPNGKGCSCGRRECPGPGKHPRVPDWPRRATTDEAQVKKWWDMWPEANVGILCGQRSGLTVLDVDPRNGGDQSLTSLESEHGRLPPTSEVATGSGGRHLYFHGVIAKGRLADGVDLQGEGSFVVAPPSRHATGGAYAWDGGPGKGAPVPLPGWVSIRPTTGRRAEPLPEGPIPDGQRDTLLTSLAGSMRRRGSSEQAILAALRVENQRCDPPLEDLELSKIAKSVGRYAPAPAPVLEYPSAVHAQLHTPPEIARDQRILDRFTVQLGVCGVVGEDRTAKLLYLALTSRVLEEPVSEVLKGVSASGKSFTIDQVLGFFPPEAYVEFTAMSERALIYDKQDYRHRTIVVFEAVALREQREKTESDITAYLIRSLLSEGRIRYPATMKTKDGLTVQWFTKDGPTNLVLSTTATSLHSENETRMLSLPTNDTPQQTAAVLRATAQRRYAVLTPPDLWEWQDFQSWISTANHRVDVPYAGWLAKQIKPVAVRLRRDFNAILGLIEAHTVLHQCSRETDRYGRIVATEEDYLAVRELVADLVSEGVGATVSQTMRETVSVVDRLVLDHQDGVPTAAVASALELDRSAAQRRLASARERGFLENLEDRRGRPARYRIGEPMPDEVVLLPEAVHA